MTLQGVYLLVKTFGKGTNLPLPPKLVEGLRPVKQYFYWINLIVAKIQAYLLYCESHVN